MYDRELSLQNVLEKAVEAKAINFIPERNAKRIMTFGDTGQWYASYNSNPNEQYCKFGFNTYIAELEMLMAWEHKHKKPHLKAGLFSRNSMFSREVIAAHLSFDQLTVLDVLNWIPLIAHSRRESIEESLELSVDVYTDAILLARRILP